MVKAKFKAGDRVKYSAAFVRSVQLPGDVAELKGKVLGVKKVGPKIVVKVKWGDGKIRSAIADNLAPVGKAERFATMASIKKIEKIAEDAAYARLSGDISKAKKLDAQIERLYGGLTHEEEDRAVEAEEKGRDAGWTRWQNDKRKKMSSASDVRIACGIMRIAKLLLAVPKASEVADFFMKNDPTYKETVDKFGVDLATAQHWARDAMVAFGPGGNGYQWLVKRIQKDLKRLA